MPAIEIPDTAPRKPCAECKAPLAMVYNPVTNRIIPVSLATGLSHFADCPNPARFSRKTRLRVAKGAMLRPAAEPKPAAVQGLMFE